MRITVFFFEQEKFGTIEESQLEDLRDEEVCDVVYGPMYDFYLKCKRMERKKLNDSPGFKN